MLEKLYKSHFLKMKHLAMRYVGQDAEDMVHDAFLKIHKYNHLEYADEASLLSTIVVNNCLDFLRKQVVKRKRIKSYDYPKRTEAHEFEFTVNVQESGMLDLLTRCERKCVEIFLLDRTTKEIADKMMVSESTVYNLFARAVKRIRSKYATEEQKRKISKSKRIRINASMHMQRNRNRAA